jgi:hypothetical protein
MVRNVFFYQSPEKKLMTKTASFDTRIDAGSRHFFSGDTPSQKNPKNKN